MVEQGAKETEVMGGGLIEIGRRIEEHGMGKKERKRCDRVMIERMREARGRNQEPGR